MKFRPTLVVSGIIAGVLIAGISSHPSHAEIIVTESQISAIKSHCVENQASLNQLHQSDAFLRIDRGNLYRTIGDKLMTPLNRRIATNRLDGGNLVQVASGLDKEYKRFYDAYIAYDTALSNLSKIDCTKEPVAFYTALLAARSTRQTLNESNQRLVQLLRDYKVEFDNFKEKFVQEHAKS